MTTNSDSYTNKLDILFYVILLVSTYYINNGYLQLLFTIIAIYMSWLKKDTILPLLYMATNVAIVINVNSILSIWAFLPVYLYGCNRYFISLKTILYAGAFLISGILSCSLGNNCKLNTFLVFYLMIILFNVFSEQLLKLETLKNYGYIAFGVVFTILVTQIVNDGLQLKYGRLSINGNIRELANAVAVPIMISFCYLLNSDSKNKKEIIVNSFIFSAGTLILIATFSKGAIISVFIGMSISIILSNNNTYIKIVAVLVAAVIMYLSITYLSSSGLFRVDRLFEDSNGFSGRTDIWKLYWDNMKNSIQLVMFGYGPGDVKRLGISSSYSHSLFLDVFFSYGILGGILFISMVISTGINVLLSKNATALSIYFFNIVLNLTHGTSTYSTFYILLATSLGLTLKYSKEDMEYD